MLQAYALREGLGAARLFSTRQLPGSDLELAKSLAFAGAGVTILPRRVAAADQQTRLVWDSMTRDSVSNGKSKRPECQESHCGAEGVVSLACEGAI